MFDAVARPVLLTGCVKLPCGRVKIELADVDRGYYRVDKRKLIVEIYKKP
jgi:hypothetical protein